MASIIGSTLFSQLLPAKAYLALKGRGWSTSGTGQIPINVVPTTITGLEIYNNSGSTGPEMVMVVDALTTFRLLGTAVVEVHSVWAQVTAPKAAPTNAALVVGSMSGRAAYSTVAGGKIITAIGTTVIASGWTPWGELYPNVGTTAAATPEGAWSVPVDGALVVPPGCSLCVQAQANVATGTVNSGARWFEVLLSELPDDFIVL